MWSIFKVIEELLNIYNYVYYYFFWIIIIINVVNDLLNCN